jgi:CheY-like chemotaxis protein/anti-sigma regulatory factor (Ser/Thr protein kinase)
MCRAAADSKEVRLDVMLGASCDTVSGDPSRLRQIVSNLLSNAIKFTPGGGRISVITSDHADGIMLLVRDTGVGIDAGKLPRIFDAFEQGGRAVTRQFDGMGLGLAIAKGFVDAHGGRIMVESDGPGRGTTVTVCLTTVSGNPPAVAIAQPPQRPEVETGSVPEVSILLVEDHPDTLAVMSRLLRRLRHRVETVSSVSAALEVAEGRHFDLLISDVGLPDGSGLELMRRLRAKTPINGIALTGYGGAEDIADTLNAGFALHLTKPIRFEELEKAVERLAGSKRKSAAPAT